VTNRGDLARLTPDSMVGTGGRNAPTRRRCRRVCATCWFGSPTGERRSAPVPSLVAQEIRKIAG
jgi:hypothetical protein